MKVLNFGSLNIDYVYSVDHFVHKGETLSSDALNVFSGGKGLNQSIAMSKAGLKVFHAGAIGAGGEFLEEVLKEAGVDTKFLYKSPEVPTGNAIIQNDKEGDNCIILFGGANQAITKNMVDKVLAEFGRGDWLVLQNEISEIPYIVTKAHEKEMKIVLNPSPINERIFDIDLNFVDCFILNEIEAQALTGEKAEKAVLLDKLTKHFPEAEIVLTLGEKGSIYSRDGIVVEQKAYRVTAVDTTAAGDTFTGYYLAGKRKGVSIKESLDIGAKASAMAVSTKGAAQSIPEWQEVLQFQSTLNENRQ